MTKAFFFDRDGVVNRDPHPEPYVLKWDSWSWMPGILELLEEVRRQGFISILVTSQKCVGKGLLRAEELESIHNRMQRELGALRFHGIYAYTGLPGCPWEAKPSPQMVQVAAQIHGLSLPDCWLLGDADRDILMGRAAGVGTLVRLVGIPPLGDVGHWLVRELAEAGALLKERGA